MPMKKSLILALVMVLGAGAAWAAPEAATITKEAALPVQTATLFMAEQVAPIETLAKQAVVIEAQTGEVLFAKQADVAMPTSSMSKVLTMYLVFDAIKNGKLKLEDMVTVSEQAWAQKGSRMFIKVGTQVKVEDLIRGVIVQSGNDAAVALAEAVAGSESSFAVLMNDTAKKLGMDHSHFTNATGLPDPAHYATAQDLAKLAMALIRDFPEYYPYYAEKEFTYNNIKQGNRNPLLYRNMGADGVKTGHTEEAGYGLIASVVREGRRIISVVNGLSNMQERADEPAKLTEWAYREYGLFELLNTEKTLGEAKVWLGLGAGVPVAASRSLAQVLPRGLKDKIKITMTLPPETEAPIQKGQELGTATLSIPGLPDTQVPLIATQDVARLPFLRVWWQKIKRMMGKA